MTYLGKVLCQPLSTTWMLVIICQASEQGAKWREEGRKEEDGEDLP